MTGAAGFIGSALARELIEQNYEVYGYDDLSTGVLQNVPPEVTFIKGDICSFRLVETISEVRPRFVFHLAAEPYIPAGYENPEKFFRTNVEGTHNLLMSCKLAKVRRVVIFSTSEVYGTTREGKAIDESFPANPHSTYGVSKLTADRMAYVYSKEHHVPVVIARPFNCYGPRESQPYIIPEIISQLAKGKTLRLGNIHARRDFTYVEDTARAAIAIAKSDIPDGSVVNIGTGEAVSVADLAELIGYRMYDRSFHPKVEVDKSRLRPHDIDLLLCDPMKLHIATGWKPKVGLSEGLDKTVDWFRENGSKWSFRV